MQILLQEWSSIYTVPDTSYLRDSEVFRSFSTTVSMKVSEDKCSTMAPLPRTTHADSFATGLCMYVLHKP